jgi:hypothetical protein
MEEIAEEPIALLEQRIVLRREMARQPEGSALLARLQDEYEYDGIESSPIRRSGIRCPWPSPSPRPRAGPPEC